VKAFREHGIVFDERVLPCGHYTTGEAPFQYMDGWWMGSFIYKAFKELAKEGTPTAQLAMSESEMELTQR
jgi:hypothetical protein